MKFNVKESLIFLVCFNFSFLFSVNIESSVKIESLVVIIN